MELDRLESKVALVSASPDFFFKFDFEDRFPIDTAEQWILQNFHQSCYFAILYLIVVYSLKLFMTHRKPRDLRFALFTWNISMAVMSFIAALRFSHELLHVLYYFGLRYSACNPSNLIDTPTTACWTYIFSAMKILEFGDTIFLVLRKKKLMFLHWFHHSSVVVMSWLVISERIAGCRWLISTNLAIHTLMYTYYAVRSIKYEVPRVFAQAITTLQILHMLMGFFGSGVLLFWSLDSQGCPVPSRIIAIGMSTYLVFSYLFLKYFYETYWKTSSREKAL